ncbi:MAG: EAL domain-containing protein [Leptospiraceae bacterium]|nr:EAL domain-containing protein [Leptospiraceae bacterium]
MKKDLRAIYYIPVIYFVIGSLWILLSDQLALVLFPSIMQISRIQTYKGLGYVALSSLLLLLLIYLYSRNVERNRLRLQESRNKLRNIVESLPAGIAETDQRGIVDFVSDRFTEIAGIPRKRILNVPIQDFFPEVGQVLEAALPTTRNPPEVLSFWHSGLSPDQRVYRIRCFARGDGSMGRRFELTDVTQSHRRDRIQKTMRELDQMIINQESQHRIFHFLCHRFQEIYSLPLCWIGIAEPDFSVRIAAHAGPRKDYLKNLVVRWDDTIPGEGPAGRAIRFQQVYRSDNPEMNMGPWAVSMFTHNLRSAVAFPLVVERTSIGVFTLYSEDGQGFRDEILAELDEVASRLSLSISFSLKKETLELFAGAMDSAANVIFVVDHLLRLEWSNKSFQERCDLKPSELFQKPVSEIPYLAGRDYQEALGRTLLTGRVWTGEIIENRGEGNQRIAFLTVTPIENDTGQIRHLSVVQEDITEVREAEQRIQAITIFDGVTGLPNRKRFEQILQQMIHRTGSTDRQLALLVLDIVRFKEINEQLGFRGGDRFLQEVSRRLRHSIPENATIFRLDGDVFAILVEDLRDSDDSMTIAKSAAEALREPLEIGDQVWTRELNCGIALFPVDGGTFEQLFNNAEIALDRSRQIGPGRILQFSEQMVAESRNTLKLHQEIYRSLKQNEFRIVFQPEFNVINQEVFRFEALMRWNHPQRGEVSPATFISVAEHFGSILDLGDFLFEQLKNQQLEWKERLGRTLPVAINLSPTQFKDPALVEKISALLAPFEDEDPFLELEITETALFSDLSLAERQMSRLRNNKLRISLDDFGTGYSSLSAVRTFPVTGLKIDRSFVSGILENHRNQAIVKSIIDLAKNMKLTVVAEGTETRSQIEILRDLGCIRCQGFLFSAPVEANMVAQRIQESTWKIAPQRQLY